MMLLEIQNERTFWDNYTPSKPSLDKKDTIVYSSYMNKVSLKDLKKDFAYWFGLAAKGMKVQVTRYNKVWAIISPPVEGSLHIGKYADKPKTIEGITVKNATAIVESLSEDRGSPYE